MREIILTLGKSALVDDHWFWRLRGMEWYAKESCGGIYAATSFSRNKRKFEVRMHRLILGLLPPIWCPYYLECNLNGECNLECSSQWEGHHDNGDTCDNRELNLMRMTMEEHRKITFSGGSIFRPRPLRPTTKFVGVRWNLTQGKWQAGWKSGAGEYIVGYYTDDVSAAIAYDYAARRLLGPKARLNFPEGTGDVPF